VSRSRILLCSLLAAGCASPAADDGGDSGTSEDTIDTTSAEADTTGDGSTTGCDDAARAVVFLAFDGVTLELGGIDDATADVTAIAEMAGTWAAAGPQLDRAAVTAGIAAGLAPFAVDVTDVRPASGRYSMVVFTSTSSGSNVIAIARPDCAGDMHDANDANVGLSYATTPDLAVRTGLAIVGQSFGLELTDGGDAMALVPIEEPAYLDMCFPLYQPETQLCSHPGCPDGQQNSHRQLTDVVGPRTACTTNDGR
jgi:hypothetical protein